MSGTKTILAFGDSLTWGADPVSGGRHRFEDRWPSVLEAGLDGSARVIAEGLGGRTTIFDDHGAAADRNGARILPTLLGSHHPLDLVIVMLGTNDLKPHVCGSAAGAGAGIERLVEIARTYPYGQDVAAPKVLIVAPPLLGETAGGDWQRNIAESEKLAPRYREAAEYGGCAFFDAAGVAAASPVDGVHLDAGNTRAIGLALIPVVRQLLA
ncbi:SGNH/GDSL hydrolase family protein [Inquilinus sp. Marseille-Q2685]|uniref:SGNH/GDSL hydrolase family protein n=1 Tax=Inquilinus sp. Marseille-Q2685 TaxID=2866581 RepID=UPI001CE3BF81|nr:SGNH/GDSL hydrolase family protein [Inquilinus sp. Marseille-Q2685]